MKKQLILCLTLLSLLATIALPVTGYAVSMPSLAVDISGGANGPCQNASSTPQPSSKAPPICQDIQSASSNPLFGPGGIVTVVVKILSIVVGFLAVIFIAVQAIRLTVSGGDAQEVANARKGIIYALVGVIVAAAAQLIVAFVLTKVG